MSKKATTEKKYNYKKKKKKRFYKNVSKETKLYTYTQDTCAYEERKKLIAKEKRTKCVFYFGYACNMFVCI